jgi:hypothetical protein
MKAWAEQLANRLASWTSGGAVSRRQSVPTPSS